MTGKLKAEYSREERWAMTGYHPLPDNRNVLKKSRRILLIDLVFLFVIGAFLYPLMLAKTSSRVLDGYRVKLKTRLLGDEVRILADIRGLEETDLDNQTITLEIRDREGTIISRKEDLLPKPDEQRILGFTLPYSKENPPKDCLVTIKGNTTALPIPYPPIPNRFALPEFLKEFLRWDES